MFASSRVRLFLPVLIFALSHSAPYRVSAQTFTVLHHFTGGGDGASPYGGLISSGSTLYGATEGGGSSGLGTVFAVNSDGSLFATLHNFAGTNDGSTPTGSLILDGDTLYGTTVTGGTSGSGTIFSLRTDGSGFATLYNFTASSGASTPPNSDGVNPNSGLVLSGDTLYGTTSYGGTSGAGTIFSLKTNGTGFTVVHTFTGGSDGANPYATLCLSGNTLYGTAQNASLSPSLTSANGTVFAVDTDGTGFTVLYSFTPVADYGFLYVNSDGANPNGVILVANTLYGTTQVGGSTGFGTVFKLNPDGTGFTNLHSFTGSGYSPPSGNDGAYPSAALVSAGGLLYGTASGRPFSVNFKANTSHTVFRVTPDGTGSTTLHNFPFDSAYYVTNNEGLYVYGELMVLSNTLYGVAFNGGIFGKGTLFSVSLPPDFAYVTNNNTITITKFIGYSRSLAIPGTINGLPVTSIEDNAFSGHVELQSVTIPASVTGVGDGAFSSCTGLTNVNFGTNLNSIGSSAFQFCSGLTDISLPEGLMHLGDYAFQSCTNLLSVVIPNSVLSIGKGTFADCATLNSITVAPLNPAYSSVGGTLFDKEQTLLIQYPISQPGDYSIPSTVQTIGTAAFSGSRGLTRVSIPNGVTTLEESSFANCSSLTGVSIPESVTNIGAFAFPDAPA